MSWGVLVRHLLSAGVAAAVTAAAMAAGTAALAMHQADNSRAPSEDAIEETFRRFDDALYSKRYAEALRIAGEIGIKGSHRDALAVVGAMKAAALLGLKREADAKRHIDEVRKLGSTEPLAEEMLFTAGLLVERYDVAADALDVLIARFPDVAREQERDYVWLLLRNEPEQEERRNEDRRIALARIGFGGDTPSADFAAADAIRILLKRGDTAAAADLLRFVDEPTAIETMLITRRYAALWPQIAQHAGARLEKVRESSVAAAQRAYEAAPEDHETLANYINALRHAGRLDEAIALRSKLPATPAAMALANEQMGWAVNNLALALHEAGKADEADALFAMLNDAPMPPEGWRVSMKINRLDRLVLDGKYERALPLIEPTAATRGSPYAAQLVRGLRYCVLSALGRKPQADSHLPEMLKHSADAAHATIDSLLCAGEVDRAEQLALQSLRLTGPKKDSFEQSLVRQLQTVALTSDDRPVWRNRWNLLKARPAIRREFDRLGRDMPSEFLVPRDSAASAQ